MKLSILLLQLWRISSGHPLKIITVVWILKEIHYYIAQRQRFVKILNQLEEINSKQEDITDQVTQPQQWAKYIHPFPFLELLEFIKSNSTDQVQLLLRCFTGVDSKKLTLKQLGTLLTKAIYLSSVKQPKINQQVLGYVHTFLSHTQTKISFSQSTETLTSARKVHIIHLPWCLNFALMLLESYKQFVLKHRYNFECLQIGNINARNYIFIKRVIHNSSSTKNNNLSQMNNLIIFFPGIGSGSQPCIDLTILFRRCIQFRVAKAQQLYLCIN